MISRGWAVVLVAMMLLVVIFCACGVCGDDLNHNGIYDCDEPMLATRAAIHSTEAMETVEAFVATRDAGGNK